MNQTAVLKALSSSPLDLLNRWKNYQDEKSKENFDTNPNFPNTNLPNLPNTNLPNLPPPSDSEAKWLFGLGAGMFFVLLLIVLLPFFIAIYLLIKNGDRMPQWAKIAGWICALLPVPGGSIIAIILVFSTREKIAE
jgi:hypothetical protein